MLKKEKQKAKKDLKLKASYVDIVNGYSQFFHDNETFFLKHHSYKDEIEYKSIYDDYYEYAKNRGVLNEEESLQLAIQNDLWSQEKEDEIEKILLEIQSLNTGKRHLKFSSQIKTQNEAIDNLNKKYIGLLNERGSLFGQTCEQFAEEKSFLSRTLHGLHYDKELTKIVFNKDSNAIDEIEEDDLAKIFSLTQGILKSFGELNIQKIAISYFFQSYFGLCDDSAYHFYGKPILELTFYQARLASWGKTFKFLLGEYEGKVSDDVVEDPTKLIDYHWTQDNQKKEQEKRKEKGNVRGESSGEFVSFVGIDSKETKEIENISSSEKSVDIFDKGAEKESGLDIMDFIEMQEGKKYKY